MFWEHNRARVITHTFGVFGRRRTPRHARHGQAGGQGGTDQLASASAGRGNAPGGRPASTATREITLISMYPDMPGSRPAGASTKVIRMFNMNKDAPGGRPADAKARASWQARLPAEGIAGDGAVGDEPVLQAFEQGLGFGRAVDSVAAEAVLGGDDTRVFQAQERLVGR